MMRETPHMRAPLMMGSVRLSSSPPISADPNWVSFGLVQAQQTALPSASVTPATSPEQTLSAASPTQPPMVLAWFQCQTGCSSTINSGVTAHPQNANVTSVPMTIAPSAPARDLLRAMGMNMMLEGSFGVYRPHARPTVDAAVSHQESLDGDHQQIG
jgi:hypothetical protein